MVRIPRFPKLTTSNESPAERLWEVNLIRAWWIVVITTGFSVVFTVAGLFTELGGSFDTAQVFDYIGSFLFLGLIWMARLGRGPAIVRKYVTEGYALFFVLIGEAYYFSALPKFGDNVAYAYSVLTPAALIYLRPRFFVTFLVVNHVVVCALVLAKREEIMSLAGVLYGASLVAAVAVVSTLIQHRTKVAELESAAVIAKKNKELAASNSGLMAMSQKMDEMMALAAHDLRTPLLSLSSLCQLEREDPRWRGREHAEFLDVVEESADSMAALVSQMLSDYSVRTSFIEGLALATCDLVSIFESVVEQAKPLAQRKGIEIETGELPEIALANGNTEAIGRVLGNLLSNAIKYSPEGSRVEVAVERDGWNWNCDVRDEGPGIPAKEREVLFNKLQRGTNLPTSGEESTGLGLYIARKLAMAMQGDIEVMERPEKGSTFRLVLAVSNPV